MPSYFPAFTKLFHFICQLFLRVADLSIANLVQLRYKLVLKQKRRKKKIKVAFFVLFESVWKLDGVYRLMEEDDQFEPVIIVCPYSEYGDAMQFREMRKAFTYFQTRGYNVINTYNDYNEEWLDVHKKIKPDIVFFLSPHPITKKEYLINNYLSTLTCYVPYTFQTTFNYQTMYNRAFHQFLWKAFYPTKIHQRMAEKYSRNRGRNVIVTGYPGIDRFLSYDSANKTSGGSKNKKKVIWAPHHTIENHGQRVFFSNFLLFHDFMLDLVNKYKDEIHFTLKPHPLLRAKLNDDKIWGQEKTDNYFKLWEQSDICSLNEGDYQHLFGDSDALIHDCDSFMAEYLSLNKPALFTIHDNQLTDRLNEFGKSAMEMHYHATNKQEIINFIEDVVINGKDIMADARSKWVKSNLTPPNSMTASMNVFSFLKSSLHLK